MSSEPQGDGRIDITGLKLVSLTAMMLLAFSAAIAMAFNIGGIIESFETSNTVAGFVATVELLCIAASSMLFSQLAPRLKPRKIYLMGIIVILSMNAATIFVPTVDMLYLVRGIAGLGAGAVVAIVMFTAGHSRTPEKTFGVINSFVGVMGLILAQLLPQALNFHTFLHDDAGLSRADGLFFVYLVFSIIALLFIRMTPLPPETVQPAGETAPSPPLPLKGWLALLGLGVVFFGHGVLALFIVRVGLEVGLDEIVIGHVFAAASLVGIVAPLIAGWVGARYPALIPTMIILITVGLFAVLLGRATTPIEFFIFAPLFAFAPIAMMPIVLGALARIDPSGRLTGAHPAFITLGGAIAPLAGGAIRDQLGSFAASGWVVAGCAAVGAALLLSAILTADKARAEANQPAPMPVPGE